MKRDMQLDEANAELILEELICIDLLFSVMTSKIRENIFEFGVRLM